MPKNQKQSRPGKKTTINDEKKESREENNINNDDGKSGQAFEMSDTKKRRGRKSKTKKAKSFPHDKVGSQKQSEREERMTDTRRYRPEENWYDDERPASGYRYHEQQYERPYHNYSRYEQEPREREKWRPYRESGPRSDYPERERHRGGYGVYGRQETPRYREEYRPRLQERYDDDEYYDSRSREPAREIYGRSYEDRYRRPRSGRY